MFKKILATFLALLAAQAVQAEIVNLVCIKPVDSEFLEKTTEYAERFCRDFPHMFDHCGTPLEEAKADRKDCESAPFAWRLTFTIDKSRLNKLEPQPIEGLSESPCRTRTYTGNTIVRKKVLVASPSFLQIGDNKDELNFNIDRKTLKAGYGIDRGYTCTIETIDTSGNAI